MASLPPPKDLGGIAGFIETIKPVLPIPALFVLVLLLYYMFRDTWRILDEDAQRERGALLAKGEMDRRPVVALVLVALILTMQEYYGGRAFFDVTVWPALQKWDATNTYLKVGHYDELWGFGWWASTRVFGYVLPFLLWKFFFREDSLLDLGLRAKGFFDHIWIYGLYFVAVVPGLLIVANSPDFGSYYPFYKASSRSWFDFLVWESMYFAQFFALEMFFRGFWLGVLRKSFGSGAIFAMAVPYCMIHYGKPYLEACGAILAGIALGSISMRTKSIYQGFLIHITVAAMMDWLSLRHRHCTPFTFWPSPITNVCTFDGDARDALAHRVETIALAVFLTAAALAVFFYLRRRRQRLAI